MTEVQQALLVRDASRRLEVERRLVDGIVESPQMEVDGQRLAFLQKGLTQAVSRMHSVLTDQPAPEKPIEAEPDADLLHEPFDDADDAFVHQLLGDVGGTRRAEAHTDPEPAAPAQAASALPAVTTGDASADAVFDSHDAAFATRLMSTHRAPEESDDAAEAQPPRDAAKAHPSAAEDA